MMRGEQCCEVADAAQLRCCVALLCGAEARGHHLEPLKHAAHYMHAPHAVLEVRDCSVDPLGLSLAVDRGAVSMQR